MDATPLLEQTPGLADARLSVLAFAHVVRRVRVEWVGGVHAPDVLIGYHKRRQLAQQAPICRQDHICVSNFLPN